MSTATIQKPNNDVFPVEEPVVFKTQEGITGHGEFVSRVRLSCKSLTFITNALNCCMMGTLRSIVMHDVLLIASWKLAGFLVLTKVKFKVKCRHFDSVEDVRQEPQMVLDVLRQQDFLTAPGAAGALGSRPNLKSGTFWLQLVRYVCAKMAAVGRQGQGHYFYLLQLVQTILEISGFL